MAGGSTAPTPAVDEVEVYVDGGLLIEDVDHQDMTVYAEITPGTHDIEVRESGAAGVLSGLTADFSAGRAGPCVDFNALLLNRQGVDDETREAMVVDPGRAPLPERKRALLQFTLSAVENPAAVDAADITSLRELGWCDSDIFDIAWHGVTMVSLATLVRAFSD